MGNHGEGAVCGQWPLLARSIPIQLYAIAVRISQIEGFAHTMIRCAIQRDMIGLQSTEGVGECDARWVKYRDVIESSRT